MQSSKPNPKYSLVSKVSIIVAKVYSEHNIHLANIIRRDENKYRLSLTRIGSKEIRGLVGNKRYKDVRHNDYLSALSAATELADLCNTKVNLEKIIT